MAKKEKVTPQKPGSEKEASMNESGLESGLPSENEQERIHVAGIGASACGLEVFEEFFTHLPPHNGIAFVLITHLNPSHMSILPDLGKLDETEGQIEHKRILLNARRICNQGDCPEMILLAMEDVTDKEGPKKE